MAKVIDQKTLKLRDELKTIKQQHAEKTRFHRATVRQATKAEKELSRLEVQMNKIRLRLNNPRV